MTLQRDYGDMLSSMCHQGKHNRCSGWLIVPNFGRSRHGMPDISVRCVCKVCKHPLVKADRHLQEAPTKQKPPKDDDGIH